MSPRRSSDTPALPRGHACLPCRRRKLRCDNAKPTCSQCNKRDEREDCEYPLGASSLTSTQVLEANVSLLEARIRDIEHPTESVRLHAVHNTASTEAPRTRSTSLSGSSSGARAAVLLSPSDVDTLVRASVAQATDLGFFLNTHRFLKTIQLPAELRNQYDESLIAVVCLWGSRFAAAVTDEADLLAQAVKNVSNSFLRDASAVGEAQSVLSLIQAEVLLANYFYSLGRLTEGTYHTSAAASLVIACRLNMVGFSSPQAPNTSASPATIASPNDGFDLADTFACDAVQIGERIDAFWTVYSLDMAWSVFTGTPSFICDQVPLVTPWPMNMAAYEKGTVPVPLPNGPIHTFLQDLGEGQCTHLALLSKATFLFSRASHLVACFHDNRRDKHMLTSEFKMLDGVLKTFTVNLALSTPDQTSTGREYCVGLCLAHAASLQLHSTFAQSRSQSRARCFAAARVIVASISGLRPENTKAINPILAMILSITVQYLNMHATTMSDQIATDESPSALLDRIGATMSDLGSLCPLMASQMNALPNATPNTESQEISSPQ